MAEDYVILAALWALASEQILQKGWTTKYFFANVYVDVWWGSCATDSARRRGGFKGLHLWRRLQGLALSMMHGEYSQSLWEFFELNAQLLCSPLLGDM